MEALMLELEKKTILLATQTEDLEIIIQSMEMQMKFMVIIQLFMAREIKCMIDI